jgi:hypothetical protein
VVGVHNEEDVTTAIKTILAWQGEFFATRPEAPARLLELRKLASTSRDALSPGLVAEGKALRAQLDADQQAWFTQRLAECPPPAVAFRWGMADSAKVFEAFALALVKEKLSAFLQGSEQLNTSAWSLWLYCRQDVEADPDEECRKPTFDGFCDLLDSHKIVTIDPKSLAGPAPDKRLADLVWSSIIKEHAKTGEVVSHADLYRRITAQEKRIRQATAWLVKAGKIVTGERGGFLPHPEDCE